MPKVSICIAVYNVEKYIEQCVRSLFEQTLDDLEYVFVDDATPDASIDIMLRVLEDYPHRKDQVKLVRHEKNCGVSCSRNNAVAAASGDYIIHCDPDDWVECSMAEELYLFAVENDADFVVCDFFNDIEGVSQLVAQKASGISPDAWKKELFCGLHGSVCNKLIKTSKIRECGAFFPEEISSGEDLFFNIWLLYNSKVRLLYLPKAFLHYCHNNQSSLTCVSEEKLFGQLWALRDCFDRYWSNGIDKHRILLDVEILILRFHLASKTSPGNRKKFIALPDGYLKCKMNLREKIACFLYFKVSPDIGKWFSRYAFVLQNKLRCMRIPEKIAVDIVTSNFKSKYNASSKARVDVSTTLDKIGFSQLNTVVPSMFKKGLLKKLFLICLYLRLRFAKTIFIQFPSVANSLWLLKKLKKADKKIILLLHDVEYLREHRDIGAEKEVFNMADILIAHTDAMKNALKKSGVTSTIQVLELFDYYTNGSASDCSDYKSAAFCGNLSKSLFLSKINDSNWLSMLYLYGSKGNFSASCSYCKYQGTFSPDDVSCIKGGWGIVWDGEDLDTCDRSDIGRYLKYNLPHKLSLYIASEKPVIIWSQAAAAEFVLKHKIGIAVDGLSEISDIILNMTATEYATYKKNIKIIAAKARDGYFLKRQFLGKD